LFTAHFGLPVSTTHTITSSILGVGASKRLSAVRWGLTAKILSAWIFTLPGAAALSAGFYVLLAELIGSART
jgi:PiT family inorganic phosphate transporter